MRWYVDHDRGPLPHLLRVLVLVWLLRDTMGAARSSWIAQLLPGADSIDPQGQAELFWIAALTALEEGDDAQALAAGERLAPLLDRIDDPFLRAVSHLAMAWMAPIAGDFDGALREASVSLEQLRGQDEPVWTGLAIVTLGSLETSAGRYDDALRHVRELRRPRRNGSTAPGSLPGHGCSWAPSRSRRAGSTTPGPCSTRG